MRLSRDDYLASGSRQTGSEYCISDDFNYFPVGSHSELFLLERAGRSSSTNWDLLDV